MNVLVVLNIFKDFKRSLHVGRMTVVYNIFTHICIYWYIYFFWLLITFQRAVVPQYLRWTGCTAAGQVLHTTVHWADSAPALKRCSCDASAGCWCGRTFLWCFPGRSSGWSHCRTRALRTPERREKFRKTPLMTYLLLWPRHYFVTANVSIKHSLYSLFAHNAKHKITISQRNANNANCDTSEHRPVVLSKFTDVWKPDEWLFIMIQKCIIYLLFIHLNTLFTTSFNLFA